MKLPRWAVACDTLAVFFALLALSVLAFGGFRLAGPFGLISVRDWMRPAFVSVVLLVVRHAIIRDMPLPIAAWRSVVRWWRSPETGAILPLHLGTRVGALVVGYLAVSLIGLAGPDPDRWTFYQNKLLDLPARWDAGWYMGIATEGYRYDATSRPDRQQNIAFFPAYPMVVRFLSPIFARQTLWVGVGVSLVAFYLALVYLLRLARSEIGDDDSAMAAITLLSVYPFAVFFSAPYTESLFLLALVGSTYYFRRDELWAAAAWGAVAGLSRPNGCFHSVVLGLMAIAPLWSKGWRPVLPPSMGWPRLTARLAAASAPGFGMLGFSAYIYSLTGHPFGWAMQNVAWGRVYRSLDTIVTDRVDYIAANGLYDYATNQALDLFYLVAVLFVLLAAWPVYRRFGLAYASMLVINVVPPIAAGGLLSMGRVTSVLFPAFLWMGAVTPARHRSAWIAFFAALQGLVAVMFFTWRPLF